MSNNESTRGRNQDRAKVAGGQDHEVAYEKEKMGTTKEAVKESIEKVGNQRTKVEEQLKKKRTTGYQGF